MEGGRGMKISDHAMFILNIIAIAICAVSTWYYGESLYILIGGLFLMLISKNRDIRALERHLEVRNEIIDTLFSELPDKQEQFEEAGE